MTTIMARTNMIMYLFPLLGCWSCTYHALFVTHSLYSTGQVRPGSTVPCRYGDVHISLCFMFYGVRTCLFHLFWDAVGGELAIATSICIGTVLYLFLNISGVLWMLSKIARL